MHSSSHTLISASSIPVLSSSGWNAPVCGTLQTEVWMAVGAWSPACSIMLCFLKSLCQNSKNSSLVIRIIRMPSWFAHGPTASDCITGA